MIKKLLLLAMVALAINAGAQTRYFTVKVSIAFKNKVISHKMIPDVGTDTQHPLYQKLAQVETGAIRYTQSENTAIVFNNEVDLLNYFENHGWDLVSVNEVRIIESKYLQYLFKSE